MYEALASQKAADLRPATHDTKYDRNESKVLRTSQGLLDCNRPVLEQSTCYTPARLWCSDGRTSVIPYWQQRKMRLLQRWRSVSHHPSYIALNGRQHRQSNA